MSAEAIQNLERFNEVLTESRARLEQMANDTKAVAGEMAASRERFDGLARELAESAPRLLSAVEGGAAQASAGLQSVATAAEAGLPDDVDLLVTQVGTDEAGAVQEVEADLASGHETLRGQGLDPLRSAADTTESDSRAMQSQVTTTMEAAFKSVTLGMDAIQGQAEQVLPDLTGHMQLYAELDSNLSVAGDGFANRVNDGVLSPLGLDAAAAAAAASAVAGGASVGGSAFTAAPGSGAIPSGMMGATGFAPGNTAGLIQDGGAYFQQGAGIVAAGGGNVVGGNGASIVAAGGGNVISDWGAGIVAAGGGNVIGEHSSGIVAAGGGNFVSEHGGAIVAAGGGNIVTDNGAGIVAAGGGNIVAAGGGNIVAAGGGNVMAHQGGNIVAAGGGNIVAAGGGNVMAHQGGNIVAAGGGNIVAAGGGNLFSDQGAGIVAAGGGNIVAAGGGNIVAAGGGNIVAAGGGNIVAAGGGNLIPKVGG